MPVNNGTSKEAYAIENACAIVNRAKVPVNFGTSKEAYFSLWHKEVRRYKVLYSHRL